VIDSLAALPRTASQSTIKARLIPASSSFLQATNENTNIGPSYTVSVLTALTAVKMEEAPILDSTTILASYTPSEASFEIPSTIDIPYNSPITRQFRGQTSVPETVRYPLSAPSPSSRGSKVVHLDIAPFLSNAGVRGMVTNVSHGTYNSAPASLIIFTFSFRSGEHGFRFKKANVKITFSKHPTAKESATPCVVKFAPRKIYGLPTRESKRNKIGGELAFEVPVGGFTIGPKLGVEKESEFETEHRFMTVGNFWSSSMESQWDVVYWDMRENRRTKKGIPDRLNVAVVVERDGPFVASVEVTVDTPVANGAFSHPWTKNNPAAFVPGVIMGAQPRTDRFDELTEEEWKALIPFEDEWENKFTEAALGKKMPISEGRSPLLSSTAVSGRTLEVAVKLLEEEESDDR
jgi:hypothetical protein